MCAKSIESIWNKSKFKTYLGSYVGTGAKGIGLLLRVMMQRSAGSSHLEVSKRVDIDENVLHNWLCQGN